MFYKCLYWKLTGNDHWITKSFDTENLEEAIKFARQNYKDIKMICECFPLSFDYPELPNAKNESGRVNRLLWAKPYEDRK